MSQSSNHLRLVSWTWQWVHFTQMSSTVTRSQSNRAPLGCDGTRDSHHGCADDKSAATAWCYHVNMNQNLWGMFNTLLNLCHEELRQFWRQTGVQPGTSKVHLIKWPVSVCIYIHIYIEVNYLKIIQCDFQDFFYSVSHSWGVPTMLFTDLSILCKWENVKNRQCIKYLFAPLYMHIYTYIHIYIYIYMKSSFPKRYKSILIVFMKMTFFYLDPYILLIFNLSC